MASKNSQTTKDSQTKNTADKSKDLELKQQPTVPQAKESPILEQRQDEAQVQERNPNPTGDRGNYPNDVAPTVNSVDENKMNNDSEEKQAPAKKASKSNRVMDADGLEELKFKQSVEPDSIGMAKGNQDDTYEFPEHEAGMVHVEMDRASGAFDPNSGDRVIEPIRQKFWPAEYKQTEEIRGFAGYKMKILHKPEELDRLYAVDANKKKK